MSKLSVADDFSRFPAGRYTTDGPFPGERFRELIVARLKTNASVTVSLDGTVGYGSSFLEEAFGGLVRVEGFTAEQLHKVLTIVSDEDEDLVSEVWSYIDDAAAPSGASMKPDAR